MSKINIRKAISVLIIIVCVCTQIVGCSGQNKQSLVSNPKEVKHLAMWKFKSNKEDYAIYDWIRQWNDSNPNVQVNLELIPYDTYLTNKLPTAFATNSAPDIYMISAGSFLKYARTGCMLPLDQYISDSLKNDFYEQNLKNATYDGKIMGIPIEREPVALFFNKQVLSGRNLKPPTDWEELQNCVKTLNTDGMSGICIPIVPNDYQNFIFYSFLVQAGGIIDNSKNISKFGSSEVKALKLWRNLSKYNYTMQTTIQSPADIYPLATGKAAMQVCGYWAVKTFEKSYPNFEYGVVPLPCPANGAAASVYGGWYQAINPNCKNTADAAAFSLWMWGGDTSRPLEWSTQASAKFPARKSVIEKNPTAFNDEKSVIFKNNILPNALPEPRYPVEMSNIISKAIQDAMFTGEDIDSITKTAEDGIKNYLKLNDKEF